MKVYRIQGNNIKNWKTFHSQFKSEMNFPDYYGENMDAWIDCVDDLSNEPTLIEIQKGNLLKQNAPELLVAIFECSAFVNFRKVEIGEQPTLMVSMS